MLNECEEKYKIKQLKENKIDLTKKIKQLKKTAYYLRRSKFQIKKVISKNKFLDNTDIELQILNITATPDGLIIEVAKQEE